MQALAALEAAHQLGETRQAVSAASGILQKRCDPQLRMQAYQILGEIGQQAGNPIDAILYFACAANLADHASRQQLLEKSVAAAHELGPEAFLDATIVITSLSWRKALIFAVGDGYLEKGEDEAALTIFNAFCLAYSGDSLAEVATLAVDEMERKMAFDGHRIGVLLPLSGAYEKIGRRVMRAIEIAVAEFNQQAPDEQAYEIVVKDSGAEVDQAIEAVKAFKEERVAGIIGPLITAREAAEEANRLAMPMIVMTQKEGIPQIGDYIFRSFLTPEIQARALVSYLANKIETCRFAIFYPDEKYGIRYKEAFVSQIEEAGLAVHAVAAYLPEQTDFGQQIAGLVKGYEKIAKDGSVTLLDVWSPRERHGNYKAVVDFDALIVPDLADVTALIAPQLRFYDIDEIILVGTNLWASDKLIEMAGPYVQGAIFPLDLDKERARRLGQHFFTEFATGGESPPGFIEAIGFDTTMIMLRALSVPDTKTAAQLRSNLLAVQRPDGLTGMAAFQPSGEPVINLKLSRIVGKRSQPISN